MSGRRVVIWRHGQTEWNLAGRIQGQLDVPLDRVGLDQARAAAPILASLNPDAVISSDLRRATDTAGELGRLVGFEVSYDAGLREADYGSWQGLTRAEIAERHPDAAVAWLTGEEVRRGETGETDTDVARRAMAAIEPALARLDGTGTLVVVTHGGTARFAIATMIGLPRAHWRVLGALSNCSWSVLRETPAGWRLAEHNAGTLPRPVFSDDR